MNLFPVLFAAVVFAVIFALAVAFKPATSTEANIPVAAARHANRWRGTGLLAGLVCAGLSAAFGLRSALLVGAPLFAICVLGGVLAGELTAPVADATARVAVLASRRLRDYVPAPPALALAVLGGCLALLLAASAMGIFAPQHPGTRCLIRLVDVGGRSRPLAPTATMLTLTIVVGGSILAALTLRVVVRRPQAETGTSVSGGDDVLRMHSAQAVLAAWGVLVTASLAGTAGSIGANLNASACQPAWATVAAGVLGPVALAAVCGMIACLAWLGARTRLAWR